MATQTQSAGSGLVPYRVTVRQFLKMIDANIFPEGARVELLGGVLTTMTKGDSHDFIVGQLGRLISPLLPTDWFLREEKSMRIGRFWRPEPDIAIVRSPARAYARRAPVPADIALLVEVADTTYPKDTALKLRRYAGSRIPVYWIVNVGKRQVELYTDPQGRGRSARYQGILIRAETDQVSVVIESQERGLIAVADLLP